MFRDGLKNKFGLNEWSGAIGDLGTTLPLAFALIVINGFAPERIFFLWGVIYVAAGFVFKVPVSVQPLKAMTVIAIAKGYAPELMSTTAALYGVLFIILSFTGAINWLQKWFSPAMISGIQLGIALILAYKAVGLVVDKGLLLNLPESSLAIGIGMLIAALVIIGIFQFRYNFPVTIILIVLSVIVVPLAGYHLDNTVTSGSLVSFTIPDFTFLSDAVIFLILPQLPLTLGNSVFAANSACHSFFNKQASRVSDKRLAASVGFSDVLIGLLGGFPVCHGAGGIAAHAQFGAKTGGAIIIIGTVFILLAIISPLSGLLFLIPVPLLGAMLLFDSYKLGRLIVRLKSKPEYAVAVLVAVISFATRNLTVALAAGLLTEFLIKYLQRKNFSLNEKVKQ